MSSILNDVKKMVYVSADAETPFDKQLILLVNSAISQATQIGVGDKNGFTITGDTETWSEWLGDDKRLEMVKMYIALKVSQLFDTSNGSSMNKVIDDELKQIEWRMHSVVNFETAENDKNEPIEHSNS